MYNSWFWRLFLWPLGNFPLLYFWLPLCPSHQAEIQGLWAPTISTQTKQRQKVARLPRKQKSGLTTLKLENWELDSSFKSSASGLIIPYTLIYISADRRKMWVWSDPRAGKAINKLHLCSFLLSIHQTLKLTNKEASACFALLQNFPRCCFVITGSTMKTNTTC